MSETKEAKAPTIHTKLLEFQKLNVSIKKGKQNPHFKSQYADINEVLEKVKEPLSTLGVVIIQIPQEEGLRTILHDTGSGTEIESYLKYTNAADPQKLGSHITYYRRYSLIALLGLEDDDDDGNGAKPTAAKSAPEQQITLEGAFKKLRSCKTVDELEKAYRSLPDNRKKDEEVIAVAREVKEQLINGEPSIEL